ncbi:hypothetical protein C8Q77DRAFT_1277865 [Trametes polyzona]|nr:hypothetical protein C8Q77DRAFT_1277865 [Trametes polyzona]
MSEQENARRLRLPTELLREIVHFYAHSLPLREPQEPRQSCKPRWDDFRALTLASKTLRQLALEAWFEVYYARSPDDLLNVWPELSSWTREMHCVELDNDLQTKPVQWNYQAFRRLRKLRVDFSPVQPNTMLLMRFDHPRNIASQLQELELNDLSWPSPMTMRLISEAFPSLRVLKLTQDLIWCSLCNICRFATFKDHPPPEMVYEKVVGLPKYYAVYLMPLTQLHTVELTVSYGLEGQTSLSKNNNMWTGECDACMDMMFTSWDGFREEWVEQKKSLERPPALKRVVWHFRYKQAPDLIAPLEEVEGNESPSDESHDSPDDGGSDSDDDG